MKYKMKIKIGMDLVMTILVLILMAYSITGGCIHEITGAMMLIFFIAHNVFNYKWYENLIKVKYNTLRTIQTIVNLLLVASILILMISGIMMSSYVFKFLGVNGGMSLARKMHMISSYWSFILISLHIGMHNTMIKNNIGIDNKSRITKFLGNTLVGIIVMYGIYAFYKHKIISYLFLSNTFVLFNISKSNVLFFVDYISIMSVFIFAGAMTKKLIGNRRD